MKSGWRGEVEKFREWAGPQVKTGEWACDYEDWYPLYDALDEFFQTPVSLWDREEIYDVLDIVAHDWGRGGIASDLKNKFPDVALFLAERSLGESHWDARWQLAEVLGHLAFDARIEPLLLRFVDDEVEYVRRRALQSLARVGSPQVEVLALREWEREDENQQWARMNALACWQRIHEDPLWMPRCLRRGGKSAAA